ncbi:uncharacterized protein DS421_16g563960 [Arachis hypogaea]|nr:uncharacterized protein DS421_16g563960 [Arachis hypogaea]
MFLAFFFFLISHGILQPDRLRTEFHLRVCRWPMGCCMYKAWVAACTRRDSNSRHLLKRTSKLTTKLI